jgi:Smg protein
MALLPSFDETHFVEQRHTLRIYTPEEIEQLPTQIRGFLLFLEQNEDLSPFHREVIIERLLDIPRDELDLKSAKLIILLVLWSQDAQISVLSVDALMESISGNPTMH